MTKIESHNPETKVVLSKKPYIFPKAIIENCEFGEYTEVRDFVNISNSSMDNYSYVCEYSQITNSKIGKFVNIASNVRINPGFHPYEMPCQHHFLYRRESYGFGEDDKAFFYHRELQKVIIGHDVWIGHGAVIMPGVKIGNGAIIGSNCVVTKDVPAYAIVVGVSGKTLRYRFPKDIIAKLEKISWWHWEYEKIKNNIENFKDIRDFLYKFS